LPVFVQGYLDAFALAKQAQPLDLSVGLAAIFHMLYHHELEMDLDQALISLANPIFPPQSRGEKR